MPCPSTLIFKMDISTYFIELLVAQCRKSMHSGVGGERGLSAQPTHSPIRDMIKIW